MGGNLVSFTGAGLPANLSGMFLLSGMLLTGVLLGMALAGKILGRKTRQRYQESLHRQAIHRHEARIMLQRGQRRFRELYERCPLGIITVEVLGQCIRNANPEFQRMFGYPEAELQKMSLGDLLAPEDREEKPNLLAPLLSLHEGSYSMEKRCVRKTGERIWVEMTAGTIATEEGEVLGLSIVADITQRKHAEEQLQRAKREAEEANAAKDQFLASLSHELRTPLTPVLLNVQALLMDDTLPNNLYDDLIGMQRNVELEARLIDDLLDLTRISHGKLQLQRSLFDLHEAINHAAEVCRPDAAFKQIRLEVSLEATVSHVFADEPRIQQVFWNLVKNAIKFTPCGGLVVIQTRNERPPQSREDTPPIIVEVSDSGVGMDMEALNKIFLPFEQGHCKIGHQFGGLGLGLAISKAIVDLHDGAIHVGSQGAGRGSSFAIMLQTALPSATMERAVRPGEQHAVGSLTILLIEDHEATAQAMARLLHSAGHQVLGAHTAQSALQMAREIHFDLVISDLGLPDGYGADLIRQIKLIHDVPAIAVSGYGMEQDIQETRDAGFEEHLVKPVNFHRLQQVIYEVMMRSSPSAHA